MADTRDDLTRFRGALVFYVNGTLPAAERAEVEAWLRNHPEGRAELEFARRIATVTQAIEPPTTEDAALDRLRGRWRRQPSARGWWAPLAERLAGWGLVPTPAIAVATVVIAVQGVLLVQQLAESPHSLPSAEPSYRGEHAPSHPGAVLKLHVAPRAEFGAVVELLRTNGCRLVGGPSEAGEVWVVVDDAANAESIRKQLVASGLIDDALAGPSGDIAAPPKR